MVYLVGLGGPELRTSIWGAHDSWQLPRLHYHVVRIQIQFSKAIIAHYSLDLASTLASSSIHGGVASIVRQRLTPAEGEEPAEPQRKILEKLEGCKPAESPVSSAVLASLEEVSGADFRASVASTDRCSLFRSGKRRRKSWLKSKRKSSSAGINVDKS